MLEQYAKSYDINYNKYMRRGGGWDILNTQHILGCHPFIVIEECQNTPLVLYFRLVRKRWNMEVFSKY